MDNDHSFNYMLFQLFFMSISISIPLILIGASFWIIAIVITIIFATAFSGNMLIAYVYRILHNIFLRPGLYIWALIVVLTGPQDIAAIGFYIVCFFQVKNIITYFIGEILLLTSRH